MGSSYLLVFDSSNLAAKWNVERKMYLFYKNGLFYKL